MCGWLGYGAARLVGDFKKPRQSRGVAQLASALAWGARGPGFKSRHPDSARVQCSSTAICETARPVGGGKVVGSSRTTLDA